MAAILDNDEKEHERQLAEREEELVMDLISKYIHDLCWMPSPSDTFNHSQKVSFFNKSATATTNYKWHSDIGHYF